MSRSSPHSNISIPTSCGSGWTRWRAFTDRGVTFALGGEERPFPLDLVPRVIAAAEWDVASTTALQTAL